MVASNGAADTRLLDPNPSALSGNPQLRFRVESFVLFCIASLFVFVSLRQAWFEEIDLLIYDAVVARSAAPMADDITLIRIDEATLFEHGAWPWPRSLQAQLLGEINRYAPTTVVMDIIYAGHQQGDAALVEAAAATKQLALPMMVDFLQADQQHIEVTPFPDLYEHTDALGHIHVEFDNDAVARGTYLYQGTPDPVWPHLMLKLAFPAGTAQDWGCTTPDLAQLMYLQKCGYVRVPFAGPANTYAGVSAQQLLTPQDDQNRLALTAAIEGKTVLVGLTAAGLDQVATPTTTDHTTMSGVEFNANLLSALRLGTLIDGVSWTTRLLFCLLIVGLSTFLLPRLRPTQMLLMTFALALVPVIICASLLAGLRIFLPAITATIAVICIYPLWSWRRHEIAWQFISAEVARIDSEQQTWIGYGDRSADSAQISRTDLSRLLGEELSSATDGTATLTAKATLTAPAAALLADVNARINGLSQDDQPGLPGEVLARRISRLERRAREVREGRAMGLAGLGLMSNGIVIASALGNIEFANSAAHRFLRLDPEATDLLEALQSLQPPLGNSWLDIARAAILEQRSISFEATTETQTPVFVAVEPLTSQAAPYAPHWIISLSDLSAIQQARAQREEALAFLSHDIRSPLLSVLAIIRSEETPSQELDTISNYTQKALSTSEQFLQLSRLQLQAAFETYELELEQVLRNAIEQSYFLAKDKGIVLSLQVDPGFPDEGAWMEGNGELLERTFINLLSNAIKYSPPDTTVEVDLALDEQNIRIDVRDQGFGIPAEELGHIFDAYFRSQEEVLARNKGAGLGLRFVKTVVERHGGRISVESQWGQGTSFSLRLPVMRG
ncbi:MAG: CHASE2 domain-containing protein [Pseudomonadota bacterium]